MQIQYRYAKNSQVIGVSLQSKCRYHLSGFPKIGGDDTNHIVDSSPKLEDLTFHRITATKGFLQPLSRARELKALRLDCCKSLVASDLKHVPKTVERLHIEGYLESADTIPIDHLTHLKSLHLCDLELNDHSYRVLQKLSSLEVFACAQCSGFSDKSVQHLEKAEGLHAVHLVDVAITDDALASLVKHPNLEYLWLPSTISAKGLRHLATCDNLRTLGIQGTMIDNEAIAVLRSIQKLEDLHLLVTKIDDSGLVAIGRMDALEQLEVFGCRMITSNGLSQFAGVSRVKRLSLRASSVDDKGFLSLGSLRTLKAIDVAMTKVSEEAIKAFRHKRPTVEVFGNQDMMKMLEDTTEGD